MDKYKIHYILSFFDSSERRFEDVNNLEILQLPTNQRSWPAKFDTEVGFNKVPDKPVLPTRC
jgi:hypothetical protein